MRNKLLLRGAIASLFGILFAMNVHSGYTKWNRLGYNAFIDSERIRFERYMVHVQPEIITILTFVIASLLIAGLYELIVFGASKLFLTQSK
jgi:hypothetical protein